MTAPHLERSTSICRYPACLADGCAGCVHVHDPEQDVFSRIIVCGGREYADRDRVAGVLTEYLHNSPVIVHGAARGADTLAGDVAEDLLLEVEPHPADWDRYRGQRPNPAGFIRNKEMAKLGADLCIAFPGGGGTEDMVRRAIEHGIPVRRIKREAV